MQNRQNNNQSTNKGFTVHVGDTYIGFITINEKNLPEDTVKNLQKPDNMKAVFAKAELRPYAVKEDQDTTSVDAIMAGADEDSSAPDSQEEVREYDHSA